MDEQIKVKLALEIAQLSLDKASLQVELEQARLTIEELSKNKQEEKGE